MRSGDTEVVKIAHQDSHLGAFRGLGNEVEIPEEQVGAARLLAYGRARSRGVALGRRGLHGRVGSARGAAGGSLRHVHCEDSFELGAGDDGIQDSIVLMLCMVVALSLVVLRKGERIC